MPTEKLPPMNLFELSRIGASDEFNEYIFDAQFGAYQGSGIEIQLRSGEDELLLWVPEGLWCRWLEPELVVNTFADIDPELLVVLASWSLVPLENWIKEKGLPVLEVISVAFNKQDNCGWRITTRRENHSLPLHIVHAPENWLHIILSSMHPSGEQQHTLRFALGWCIISESEEENITPGSALPVYGMDEEAETFWLCSIIPSARISFQDAQHATVAEDKQSMLDTPSGTKLLTLEVGNVNIFSHSMDPWEPGQELEVKVQVYPLVNIIYQEEIWAQGQLIKFNDSWGIKINTMSSTSSKMTA